jgi:hypothetical protein
MATTIPQINYSWDFLKKFQIGAIHGEYEWQSITRLIEKSEQAIKPHIQECQVLEIQWEKRLRPLCGDQTIDWSEFRPLRQSREEDWSDWLAWLLKTSQTGILADSLFADHMNCQPETFKLPTKVKREEPLPGRRADIVISWEMSRRTHIEVKIGDRNFDKTFETAIKVHETARDSDWSDFILIPRESKEAWNEVAQKFSGEKFKVIPILWDDVACGLRRCLWHGHETVFWRAWAWVFCSVIEKKLLGLEKLERDAKHPKIQMILQWLKVLKINPGKKYE